MTHTEIAQIVCSQCQTPLTLETYTQVDVHRQPDLRARFLSAEPFQVTCPNCGHEGWAEYAFLYQDLDHGFVLFYEPNPERFKEDTQMLTELYAANHQIPGLNMRIVHGLPNFWEKIQLFEAGLDDRIIEIQKCLVAQTFVQAQGDPDVSHIFYEAGESPHYLIGDQRQLKARLPFNRQQYDQLVQRLEQEIARYGGGFVINQQWALWLLNQADVEA